MKEEGPVLSIIVNVHNAEHQIAEVVYGIIETTTTPFELVIVYDGCTDRLEEVASRIIDRGSGLITDYKALRTPDILETLANNEGMKTASGKYYCIFQDDMKMQEKGWEKRMLRPFELWDDVFAVTLRDAMDHCRCKSAEQGARYKNFYAANSLDKKNIFYKLIYKNCFAVRDVVNRGPLCLDAQIVQELNYFDVSYAPLSRDDADLCMRAYIEKQKVCGAINAKWVQLLSKISDLANACTLTSGDNFKDVAGRNWHLFYDRHNEHFGNSHAENRRVTF